MKVRVVSCAVPTYWYAKKIGQEFEMEKAPDHNGEICVYCDDERGDDEDLGYIVEGDWEYVYDSAFTNSEQSNSTTIFDFLDSANKSTNKYLREIKPGVFVDIYDVLRAWNVTDPCLQHAAKKVLQAGERGHKDRLEDLNDIVASTNRAIEMHKEWNS